MKNNEVPETTEASEELVSSQSVNYTTSATELDPPLGNRK